MEALARRIADLAGSGFGQTIAARSGGQGSALVCTGAIALVS